MTFDTGARLKAEREARKLSQRQLAALAGVTAAMISMIEQNRTSPSIGTLKKILSGLNMPLSAFFAEDEPAATKWHFTHEEFREITPPGGSADPKISFLRVGHTTDSALLVLYEHYKPGADTGPDLYSHESEEAGVVVEGQIELTVGTETRLLKTGDGYHFNSRQPHRFRNPGPGDCVIVSGCTPPTF
ncbi:cupin domain-containing protein [Frigidibacter sp. SD6-1]|uniref:cupin domain-containing protein n=1 Tax=Frigidibacter sp. SD6-1 TaxID=3032581 RepID=UPI0024DF9441|nr:cupin domain-containing protein [Frigidibacter sp. SD6-1]